MYSKLSRLLMFLQDRPRKQQPIDGVTVFGPSPNEARTPTVSFIVKDVPAIEVTQHLVERGVYTSHGDFYAMTVIERLGQSEHGVVRAGCACYTTAAEVERLLEGVRQLVR